MANILPFLGKTFTLILPIRRLSSVGFLKTDPEMRIYEQVILFCTFEENPVGDWGNPKRSSKGAISGKFRELSFILTTPENRGGEETNSQALPTFHT